MYCIYSKGTMHSQQITDDCLKEIQNLKIQTDQCHRQVLSEGQKFAQEMDANNLMIKAVQAQDKTKKELADTSRRRTSVLSTLSQLKGSDFGVCRANESLQEMQQNIEQLALRQQALVEKEDTNHNLKKEVETLEEILRRTRGKEMHPDFVEVEKKRLRLHLLCSI